jgi:hypothetical protein
MKKYILVILSVMLILNSASCTLKKDLPVNITIEGKEYQRSFIGELYPLDTGFPDADDKEGIRISGEYYYKYQLTDFDCYIAYDNNAEPNVYFESGRFEDAVSYYKNAENFKFFCLLGNIHDENHQQILEIKEIDSLMLDQLLEFSKGNDYNQFTSFNKEEGITTVSIPDPNDWMADEIHFYKESKDGAFSTSKAYTFILYEDKLCFQYQYDFTDEKSPVMLIRYVPTEISDYFCSLLENLQNK